MKHFIKIWFALARLPWGLFSVAASFASVFLTLLFFIFARERRAVLWINLRLCFAEKSVFWRGRTAFSHVYIYIRTFFDRAWLWQTDENTLQQRVHIRGLVTLLENLPPKRQALIILAPHFLGLDAGWSRLNLEISMATMYANQKNPILNQYIKLGRSRFGASELISRQDGVRTLLRYLKQGKPLYYLPDMDFGERDAVFVPFFGVSAATVTAVARLARLTQATVLLCPTYWKPSGLFASQYTVEVAGILEDFPGSVNDMQATTNINAAIEQLVKQRPAQYLWTHKRFKTQPPGAQNPYGCYR